MHVNPQAPPSRAHLLVVGATASLAAATLAEVLDAAELLNRVDNKYLLPVELFPRFVDALEGRFCVLDMGGLRAFAYESVYFDTETYALFRHHQQGRRRRFKARTRTYVDSGSSMFEVKLKSGRGATVKSRIEHPFEARNALTETARTFLDETIGADFSVTSADLAPRIETRYRRATLVDLSAGARVTCDVDLVCDEVTADGGRTVNAGRWIIVETKTTDGRGVADTALRTLGLRPVRMSKYCMAVALLNPHLPANRWSRTLRHYYGYDRSPLPRVVTAPPGRALLPPRTGRHAAMAPRVPSRRLDALGR